jgi:hypothetical protein
MGEHFLLFEVEFLAWMVLHFKCKMVSKVSEIQAEEWRACSPHRFGFLA